MRDMVQHVGSRVYLVRVVTEWDAENRHPLRHGWVTAQFGEQAILLRASTPHDKRTARKWAEAWLRQATPTESIQGVDNLIPSTMEG